MKSTIAVTSAPGATVTSPRLRTALYLTVLIIPLAALAAGLGLFFPGVYARNPATIIPALRGQDLVTLLALPPLIGAWRGAWRGAPRATLLWIGLLGYLGYTYTGAAIGYFFSEWTLLYIGLFSLAVFALGSMAGGIDAAAIAAHFDERTPRRAVAGFLVLIGLMLAGLELGQIAGFITTGELPAGVVAAGSASYFVYGLDLGLVMPLTLLGAAWIWQGRAWSYLLAGVILVKAVTMGLALLAMNLFIRLADLPTDPVELLGFYSVLVAGGLAMGFWFLRHCRG
jgi:hypothetical protein